MVDENELRRVVGLADVCELLASATPFPNENLANALADGGLAGDALACLEDCGVAHDQAVAACSSWDRLVGQSASAILADIRRTHSLLFVRQGSGVAVWPYESAFLHVRAGKTGEPALFRGPVTLEVEQAMREVGVLPRDSRVEPCDSVWDEFMFLSYLFGNEADALNSGDAEAVALYRGRSAAFAERHALRWMPGFFGAIERKLSDVAEPESASHLFYGGLCSYGTCVMELLSRD